MIFVKPKINLTLLFFAFTLLHNVSKHITVYPVISVSDINIYLRPVRPVRPVKQIRRVSPYNFGFV
jgi:hypothetical protein